MLPVFELQLLGGFRLVYDNRALTNLNTLRLQSLLAFLILHADTPQSRQHIAFVFWPDTNESHARNNLRQFLHQLRQTLPDPNRFLVTDANSVIWKSDASQVVDVFEFQHAMRDAKVMESRSDSKGLQRALQRAVSQYRGELLPSCYDDWITPERERLQLQCRQAYRELLRILEAQREYTAAIQIAEALIPQDPLDEETYQTLMRLHSFVGNQLAVQRVYQQAAQTLERELGTAPTDAFMQMYERLRHASQVQEFSADPLLKLIGRKQEWQQLQAAWTRAVNGDAHLVLITGEAGIGKSRLAEELFHWATRQGITAAHSRSYEAEGRMSLAPVTDWLRSEIFRTHLASLDKIWLSEVTRLLPELVLLDSGLARPEPITEYGERQRFFEALARAILAAPRPMLLWIDDLQWCDAETFEWLHFLLRFEPNNALLILGTARGDESPHDHPLVALTRQLQREGKLSTVELSALDAAETAKLGAQISGRELDAPMTVRLYRETEGNPLFVVETMREEESHPLPAADTVDSLSPRETHALPPRVHAVIAGRLANLSPTARKVAALGAAIGHAFTLELLQRASSESEDLLFQALDELWQKRIVREQRANVYDFTHDKLREVAYVAMSAPQRNLFHRRIAQALEDLNRHDPDAVSAELAAQYEQAGLPAQAIPYYQRAGMVAANVYANQDAIHLFNRGLGLLSEMPPGEKRDAQELAFLLALAPIYRITRGWAAQATEQVANRARDLSMTVGTPEQRVQALWIQQTVDVVAARFERVMQTAAEMQLLLRAPNASQYPFIEIHFAGARFLMGQLVQAREIFESMLGGRTKELVPDLHGAYGVNYRAHSYVWYSHMLWCLGYPQQALATCEEGVRVAQETALPFNQALTLTYLATLQEMCAAALTFQLQAQAAEAQSREFEVRYYHTWAAILTRFARATEQPNDHTLEELRDSICAFEETGARIRLPYYYSLLARACSRAARYEQALSAMEKAFAQSEQNAEHWWDAELWRLRGELLWSQGAQATEIEAAFRQSLNIARLQQARSLELRGAMSMARLAQAQGKGADARELLVPLYGWFTEGFDTPDLQNARALIARLERD